MKNSDYDFGAAKTLNNFRLSIIFGFFIIIGLGAVYYYNLSLVFKILIFISAAIEVIPQRSELKGLVKERRQEIISKIGI